MFAKDFNQASVKRLDNVLAPRVKTKRRVGYENETEVMDATESALKAEAHENGDRRKDVKIGKTYFSLYT